MGKFQVLSALFMVLHGTSGPGLQGEGVTVAILESFFLVFLEVPLSLEQLEPCCPSH